MGAAYFYHLTRTGLDQTLPMLLTRALQNGWRVEVRGADAARMRHFDEIFWTADPESFLPHALAGGAQDQDQPVLLTTSPKAANDPHCLMLIDGAALDPAELAGLQRACVIFDGNDQAALTAARALWKAVGEAGAPAQYWSEESGRWEKKAER